MRSNHYQTFKLGGFLNFSIDGDKRVGTLALEDSSKSWKRIGAKPYKLGDGSFTSNAIENNKIQFSYNIDVDPSNSHKFDEKTKFPPKNWIGIPISTHVTSPIGVLRVKNKLNEKRTGVMGFDNIDLSYLKMIAENISYQYGVEQDFFRRIKEKGNELLKKEEENKELREFLRKYRHELRTGLNLITTAPQRIIDRICSGFDITEEFLPKRVYTIVSDLEVAGKRMEQLINTLSFDPEELVKELKKNFLFKDVVMPIVSFQKLHAKRMRRTLNYEDHNLQLPAVRCDSYSAQMAFHILIDNALKYSKKNSTIDVSGYQSSGFVNLAVSNTSEIEILTSEKDKLFRKFFRAEEVEKNRYEGSGIGLYLAKEIMERHGGKVFIANLNRPTVFVLSFKIYEI